MTFKRGSTSNIATAQRVELRKVDQGVDDEEKGSDTKNKASREDRENLSPSRSSWARGAQ